MSLDVLSGFVPLPEHARFGGTQKDRDQKPQHQMGAEAQPRRRRHGPSREMLEADERKGGNTRRQNGDLDAAEPDQERAGNPKRHVAKPESRVEVVVC